MFSAEKLASNWHLNPKELECKWCKLPMWHVAPLNPGLHWQTLCLIHVPPFSHLAIQKDGFGLDTAGKYIDSVGGVFIVYNTLKQIIENGVFFSLTRFMFLFSTAENSCGDPLFIGAAFDLVLGFENIHPALSQTRILEIPHPPTMSTYPCHPPIDAPIIKILRSKLNPSLTFLMNIMVTC